jgi:uncharacterized protein
MTPEEPTEAQPPVVIGQDGAADPSPDLSVDPRPPLTRRRAIGEAVLCSSYPTQVVAAGLLAAMGVSAQAAGGGLNATFVIGVSMLDAVLVVGLILVLLWRRGESLADVCLGTRAVWREAALGLSLVLPVTLGVAALILGARTLWPSLHNVAVNPLAPLMADPRLVVVFALVVVIAGGVREEVQRAFQLHRLTPLVLGPKGALLVASVAFGLGHTVQGRDVALATFALGLTWGALYLGRRSIVAGAVCHGLFNLGQVAAGWTAGRAVVETAQAVAWLSPW